VDETPSKPNPVEVLADALRAFGEDTAAGVAEKIGMAYSTVTPKLRALEEAGRAERVRRDGRTFWRLVATAAAGPEPAVGETSNGSDTAEPAALDATPEGAATDEPGHAEGASEPGSEPPATAQPQPAAESAAIESGSPTGPAGRRGNTGTEEVSAAEPDERTQPGDDPGAPDAPAVPDHGADTGQSPGPGPFTSDPSDGTGSDATGAPQPATDAAAATLEGEKNRRPPGELDRTALRIMQANPHTPYKVTELARLIDQADAADGHTYPKASPGAVVLACDRLADRGNAMKVNEKPATYRLAAAQPANP